MKLDLYMTVKKDPSLGTKKGLNMTIKTKTSRR